MFSKFALSATALLSILQVTYAEVTGTTAAGVGASVFMKPGAAIQTGFNANFYDLPIPLLINFNDNDFMADGYTAIKPRASTSLVTSPNFSLDDNDNASIYGLYNQDLDNTIMELKGYYHGTYHFKSHHFPFRKFNLHEILRLINF